MSYLNGPRVNFWGGIQINVCTTNNEIYEVDGSPQLDVVSATVVSTKTDAELEAFFRTPTKNSSGANYYCIGGWNYYGDHSVRFMNANVSSSGEPGSVSQDGPLVGQGVYLLGSLDPVTGSGPDGSAVMVDIDPTSSQTTQIYVGGLQIGPTDSPALLIQGDGVCHSRFLGLRLDAPAGVDSPGSFAANGTFQVTFPLDAVKSYDASNPTLRAIMTAPGVRGIVLRFSVFECLPYMDTPELQADYAANNNSSNPSSGHVIGSIGPAFDGEPDTVPPGRWLENTSAGSPAGLAFLDAEQKRLTLDMVSLIYKAELRSDRKDYTGPIGPNTDYGLLTVSAGGSSVVQFDPLPASYFEWGGVLDIPLDTAGVAALSDQAISITGTSGTNTLIVNEVPLRIYSNARNIYLDSYPNGAVIAMLVRYLGGPLPEEMTLSLTSQRPGEPVNENFLEFPDSVVVPKGARSFSFAVHDDGSSAAGFEAINITGAQESETTFVNFRKYPSGDLPPVPGGGPDWSYVYVNVLRYFALVFPAMSKRIPLAFEGPVRATGPVTLQRTSPPYLPTTLYMPLTRALSPERIRILREFLGGGPTA